MQTHFLTAARQTLNHCGFIHTQPFDKVREKIRTTHAYIYVGRTTQPKGVTMGNPIFDYCVSPQKTPENTGRHFLQQKKFFDTPPGSFARWFTRVHVSMSARRSDRSIGASNNYR